MPEGAIAPDPMKAAEKPVQVGYVVSVSGARIQIVLTHAGAGITSATSGDGERAAASQAIRVGALVKVLTDRSFAFGLVSRLYVDRPSFPPSPQDLKMADVDLIGEALELADGGTTFTFRRGVSVLPILGQPVLASSQRDLAQVYARPRRSYVRVGSIHQDADLPAYLLSDELLGNHFAVLGTTGTGKSCTVALILHSLLEAYPHGHIILLDPHNEYRSGFEELAEVFSTSTLRLPYWLLNFEESAEVMIGKGSPTQLTEAEILKQAILAARQDFAVARGRAEHLTVDSPVPYRLTELLRRIDDAMGRLDNPETAAPYLRIKSRIDSLRTDLRYGFMFSGVLVEDSMTDVVSQLFRIPVDGRPMTIIDLSGVPSEIIDVVVSVIARMLFNFALWSAHRNAVPLLLVCEEAHRYVPRREELGCGPTRRAISRIAAEGRKYGVSLCLISQRPAELSETILSQCSTLFALRMSNEADQRFVRGALPDNALGLLEALPALRNQEAIVVGEGVTVPTRLRFDDLAEDQRPRSQTAAFSQAWQQDSCGIEQIEETLQRWRRQTY